MVFAILAYAIQHMGAKHNIHTGITLFDFFRDVLLLYHTAAHTNNHIRTGILDMGILSHDAKDTLFRMLPHRTGIDHNHIGLLSVLCPDIAHFRQHTGNTFGIRFILLAAKGLTEKHRLFRQKCIMPADLLHAVQLMGNLLFWYLS